MTPKELKAAIRVKHRELDTAMEAGNSQQQALRIYKELKELQYQLVQAELKEENRKSIA
jgi:hypothetical protein